MRGLGSAGSAETIDPRENGFNKILHFGIRRRGV
jgi:hypothetical protein